MTVAETDLPELGLGSELKGQLTQLAMAAAQAVQAARMQEAWSTRKQTALQHERSERLRDPAVRVLTDAELTQLHGRAKQLVDQGYPDEPMRREQGTASDGSWVELRIDPLSADRWALRVRAAATDYTTAEAAVSCTPAAADGLIPELLAGGVDRVARLAEFSALASARAQAEEAGLGEPEDARLHRTAEAIEQAWPHDQDLVDDIISRDAFGAFAHWLSDLEERGHPMPRALELLGSKLPALRIADDPAAMAASFAKKLRNRLAEGGVDLGGEGWADLGDTTTRAPRARRGEAGRRPPGRGTRTAASGSGPASDSAATSDSAAASGSDPVADSVTAARAASREQIRRAMPEDAARKVLGCRYWKRFVDQVATLTREGQPVEELLRGLPAHKIAAANWPAAYASTTLSNIVGSVPAPSAAPRAAGARPSPTPRPVADSATEDAVDTETQPLPISVPPESTQAPDPASLDSASAVDQVALAAMDHPSAVAPSAATTPPVTPPAPMPRGEAAAAAPAVANARPVVDLDLARDHAAAHPGSDTAAAARAAVAVTPPPGPSPVPSPRPRPVVSNLRPSPRPRRAQGR
jgi:hypothetical protein